MQGYGEGKQEQSDVVEKNKLGQKTKGDMVQIGLRLVALGTSIAATWLTFTSSQTALVYGVPMDAKYSYTSAFKFYALANAIASVFALLSLSLAVMLWRYGLEAPNHLFFFFLHDLGIMSLLLAGCSAASAIGYVGQYGNDHAGWLPICDHFQSFCHRVMAAVILGYFSLFAFLFLTILSATKYSTTSHHSVQVQNSF